MERILIIKLGALGDIVRTEGVLHDIRNHHWEAEITIMTTPAYERIFERCPWTDKVFVDPRASRWNIPGMLDLRKRLRMQAWDKVYDLQKVSRTAFYHYLFLPGVSWSGNTTVNSRFNSHNRPLSPLAEAADQLESAGVAVHHSLCPDLSWFADDVTDILNNAGVCRPFTVLIPGGSSGHPEKRWPYYRELGGLLSELGRQVVTIPGPDDMALCATIPGIMLTGPGEYLGFFKLAGVLRQAEFVVGNDTGPSHIASHLGCRGLALFSNHVPAYMTDIERGGFRVIEVDDLRELPVERVYREIIVEKGV